MDLKRNSRSITRAANALGAGFDLPLIAALAILAGISVLNMYGIGGLNSPFFTRHVVGIVITFIVMGMCSFFNYRYLKNYSAPVLIVYGLGLIVLLLTLISPAIRGSRAWIVIAGFSVEPSEFIKPVLVIVMAKYFSQRHTFINQFRHIIISGIYVLIPLAIVILQPDLGSACVLIVLWLGMLLAVGVNLRHLFLIFVAAVIATYLAWMFALQPYQKERLSAFIDPYRDPMGIGYNTIQSQVAIGSGSWFGRGLGNGSQATLGFLPEAHNDFAFAALAEQFGLVGVSVVWGLVGYSIMRILKIGERTGNNFGRLFALGLAIIITVHVFVNAAVNVGIMPITGIPFTFLSAGGSHLLAIMMGIGILQSMKRYG